MRIEMIRLVLVFGLLCSVTAVSSQQPARWSPNSVYAQPERQPESPDGTLRSTSGLVEFVREIEVPAAVDGKLTKLDIREGDEVEQDQLIGVIDDTAAKHAVRLKEAEQKEAKLNALDDVNRRFATKSKEVAVAEYKSVEDLFERFKGVSFFEKEKKRLEAERADLQIELANLDMDRNVIKYLASGIALELAQHELDQRQINVPFSGVIEERFAQQGEWVQAGTPIAKLVQMDTLKVKGDLPALGTNDRIYKGAGCEVHVYVRGYDLDPEIIESTLMFVGNEVDSSGRRRCWTEVQNRKENGQWLLTPGMTAEIVVK